VNDDCFFFLFLPFMNAAIYTLQKLCFEPHGISTEAARDDSIAFKSGRLLSDSARLVLQDCQCEAILVPSLSTSDFGLCLLKLRLAQFNNRTEP
jgi:hypothetical protein